jgi:hypothetical protein
MAWLERLLHDRFSVRRRNGEWFSLEQNAIEELCKVSECNIPSGKSGQEVVRKGKSFRLEFKADKPWLETVMKEAGRMGLSLSAYIRVATREKMNLDAPNPIPNR